MAGKTLQDLGFTKEIIPKHFSVKEAVFPFNKFLGVDPILGPEMRSTGEVMGIGKDFASAFDKAQLAAGDRAPENGKAFVSLRKLDREYLVELAEKLVSQGFSLSATRSNQEILVGAGLECEVVNKVSEGSPHIVDMIKNDDIDLIVNSTEDTQGAQDFAEIRRQALVHKITCITTVSAALATLDGLKTHDVIKITKLQDL
jgi:carbamoyl-phosphate synthase large subunit